MARVKWNEENLAEIEANKPERQKITEPKTPYHPMISDDDEDNDSSSSAGRGNFGHHFDDAMIAEELHSSVNDVGSSSKTSLHHSGWTSSEDEEDEMDQDSDSERRKCFREHRKVHYDEFLKIKELRRKGSHLEEDSDEESSITAGVKDMDIKESSLPANGS